MLNSFDHNGGRIFRKGRSLIMKRNILGCVILLLFLLNCTVEAAGYGSYSYDSNGLPAGSPEAASTTAVITNESLGISPFGALEDLYVGTNGKVYVTDTSNGRILVLSLEGTLLSVIDTYIDEQGQTVPLGQPSGIFVSHDDVMLVADEKNERVLQLDSAGRLIRYITSPDSDLMPENFVFLPRKVGMDSVGRIFVISGNFNMGILEFDPEGHFVQYMGAAEVTYSALDLLWRSFMTKEQRERSISFVPTEYNNLFVDEEDFIYVTTSELAAGDFVRENLRPVRRLNAKGVDVLSRSAGRPIGDLSFNYWTETSSNYTGPSAIVDVTSLGGGAYALLDQKRGRIFAYNREGELMYLFGGYGEYNGAFKIPTAIGYHDGRYYISDKGKNAIYIFSTTEYSRLFHEAIGAREEGDARQEELLWEQIYHANVNCVQAIRNLGDAAYRNQDMLAAMSYYQSANNREGYSKAYTFVRRQWIEKNFIWAGPLFVGIIAVFYLLIHKCRAVKATGMLSELAFVRYSCFHPLSGFWDLKHEKRATWRMALILLTATFITMIAGKLFTGFLFNTTDISSFNMLLEIAVIAVALAAWCVSQWCVTALMDGEGTLGDIFKASCYALLPYIVTGLAATLISHVLTLNEGEFHSVLITIGIVWTAFLLVISVKQTHNYSMLKTILVIVIMLVVILLASFVVMLVLALSQQFWAVVRDLYDELTLRL